MMISCEIAHQSLLAMEAQILMSKPPRQHFVTAFFDESGKLKDELVSFGGCVGDVGGFNRLITEWGIRLRADGLEYTSMKEAINWGGPYVSWSNMPERRDALLFDLASIVCNVPLMRMASPMTTAEFKALPRAEQKLYGGDLQYCGLEACIKGILNVRNDFVLSVICDLSDEYSEKCVALFNKLRRRNQTIKDRCIGISFLDDRFHFALQAADMISYCARAEKLSDRSREYPIVTKLIDLFASQDRTHSKMLYQAGGFGLGDGEIQITNAIVKA